MDDLNEFWGQGDLLGYAVKFSAIFPFAGALFSVMKLNAPLRPMSIVFTMVICQLVSVAYAIYRDERRSISFAANMWIVGAACFLGWNFISTTPAEFASGSADVAQVFFSMIFILLTTVAARLRTVAYQNGGGSSGSNRGQSGNGG